MSSRTYLDANGACSCDNCQWKGDAEELNGVADISQRVDPGSIVPAGECPECGALAYMDEPDDKVPEHAHELFHHLLAIRRAFYVVGKPSAVKAALEATHELVKKLS